MFQILDEVVYYLKRIAKDTNAYEQHILPTVVLKEALVYSGVLELEVTLEEAK